MRLFVAVRPPDPVVEELRRLPRPDDRGVRWVPESNWHVTLRFLGDEDPDRVAGRLAGIALPGAAARLGPAVRRLGGGIVVPVSGVDELAAAVTAATGDVGTAPGRRFRGHLTLARATRGARSSLLGTPIEAGFDVVEVLLMRSHLEPSGARYTALARFPTGSHRRP